MRKLIKRNISGSKVLSLFLVTNILYVTMLTVTIPKVMNYAGGMKLFDMMPAGYSPEYVVQLLTRLGEKGRHAYLFSQLPVDMIYPFFFGIGYCLILAFFLNKLGRLESNFFYLCLIPIFSGLFDYAENIGIITMLNEFPNNSIPLSGTTNIFSVLKSACTTIYFIVLLITMIIVGKNRLFRVKSEPNKMRKASDESPIT